MSLQFTQDGLVISTFDEVFNRLATDYRNIYGQDINLDPDSPDGERVGIEAKARADIEASILQLYDSFDPDLATGDRLFSILKLSGTRPRPATRSQWDIQVTTDRPLTLDQDYTIEDEIGQLWFVPEQVSLPQGTTTVTFRSRLFGSIEGLAGSDLSQVTVVLGVTGFNATVNASVGQDEETEQELREKRNRSLQLPSRSTTGGLFAKIANTAGVTDLQVYENDTGQTDTALNLGAHSLWVIVEGGTQSDIAEAYAKSKTGGTPMKGAITATFVEEIERPNGGVFTINHNMKFDRPTLTEPYIRASAKRKDPNVVINTDVIEQALNDVNLNIGQDLVASELYDQGYTADGSFILFNLEVSRDGITWTDERVEADPDEKFITNLNQITVTEVV